MSARTKAVEWALSQLGAPVLMGYRGDVRFNRQTRRLEPHNLGFKVWDCSGLFTGAILAAGGPDLRGSLNAQLLHDGSRDLVEGEDALPGDGVYYGHDAKQIIHVGLWLAGGKVLSADGATWGVTDIDVAKAMRARVRLHETRFFRQDCPYIVVKRNVWLDAIDRVTR